MFAAPLHLEPLSFFSYSFASFDALCTEINRRIKDVAIFTLKQFSLFLNSYENRSNEGNVKTFALIGFISLIFLLSVSIFRTKASGICPPPTPYHKGGSDIVED